MLNKLIIKVIISFVILILFSGCDDKGVSKVLSAYDELVEDISGNKNGKPISAKELNSIDGVEGAIEGVNYTTELQQANYKDPKHPTAQEIQAVINRVNAKEKIKNYIKDNTNEAPTIKDYEDAGIKGVNKDNIEEVNSKLAEGKKSISDIQKSVDDINKKINATKKIESFAKDNNSTSPPTLQDYIDAGIDGVNEENIDKINDLISQNNIDSIDDIKELIKKTTDNKNSATTKIIDFTKDNNSTNPPNVNDYKEAGIDGVNEENIDQINDAISKEGNIDNINKVKEIVDKTIKKIQKQKDAVNKIKNTLKDKDNNTILTPKDYEDAGVKGVNNNNIEEVNSKLANSNLKDKTQKDIQEIVDNINKKNSSIKTVKDFIKDSNSTKPTIQDFKNMGIDGVNKDNIDEINSEIKELNSSNLDSNSLKEEIEQIVNRVVKKDNALNKLKEFKNGNNSLTPTVNDYIDLGVSGVDNSNIKELNQEIKKLTKEELNSIDKIQETINKINNKNSSLNKIKEFAKDSNATSPTLQDYINIGVSGVNSTNLDKINEAIKSKDEKSVNSIKKIQELIDSINKANEAFNKIKDFSDGNSTTKPTLQDYLDIGIRDINESNIEYVNSALKESKINNSTELQNLVDSVNKKLNAIKKIKDFTKDANLNAPTIKDYEDAGISGVNSSNLELVNSKIGGSNIDSLDKIQEEVNLINTQLSIINKIKSFVKEGTQEPNLQDYVSLGINGVDSTNIDRVNEAIKSKDISQIDSISKIQDVVNSVNKTINALNKIKAYAKDSSNITLTLQDYIDAKIVGVNSQNIDEINKLIESLDESDVDSSLKIQAIVDNFNKKSNAFNKIKEYANGSNEAPTVQDYIDIGVNGVNSSNLDKVNKAVKSKEASQIDSISTIQNIIDSVNRAIDALDKIKAYAKDSTNATPTLQDYIDAGFSNVNSNNINAINSEVANSGLDSFNKLQELIDKVFTKLEAIDKILAYANGSSNTPTLQDYIDAEVSGVSEDNLDDINNFLANSKVSNITDVQDIVDKIVAKINSLNKIKSYANGETQAPTLQDYLNIGIVAISQDNLEDINSAVKQKSSSEVDTPLKIKDLIDSLRFNIKALYPTNQSTNVSANIDEIKIEYKFFRNKISKVSGKSIGVYKYSGDIAHTISTNNEGSDTTAVNNSTISVKLSGHLVYGAKHYIKIDSSAFIDDANYTNKGVDSKDRWTFEVPSGSGPCGCDEFDNSDLDQSLQ